MLASELLRNADLLLSPLTDKVHGLLAAVPRLQDFLADVEAQAAQPKFVGVEPAAVRAFLFDIDFEIDQNRRIAIRLDQAANFLVCASFVTRMIEGLGLSEAIALVKTYDQQIDKPLKQIAQAKSANEAMMIAIAIVLDSHKLGVGESQQLQEIAQPLSQGATEPETIQAIADAARDVAKGRHYIGHQWTFDDDEKQLLKQYYQLAQLIADCLHSEGCMLTPERRQAIEQGLFRARVI